MSSVPQPRPSLELSALAHVWRRPRGWRVLSAVNNTHVGIAYLGTAVLFLLLGGGLALLMRVQLAVPGNTLVDAGLYNQLFTMHGSVMMFLFAVPVVEAIGVLLLPAMVGARDLPFPRLSAYAFWAYALGGLGFFASLFVGLAPDGGWTMYPPLTSYQFSPGRGADVWLLGIGFLEISAIAGAVEIVVGILRTRAPGMSLSRMPVYVWAMLVTGFMIILAFPAIIAATALLELERAFHWPIFIAEGGGDPLLWQHLFWLFGHPDVYIIFLPAAGMISMMVSTLAGTRLAEYPWMVGAMIATGIIAFVLWVHHMFTVGMSHGVAGFFSAASMAVAIPAGVQVFGWLATLRKGQLRNATPAWFVMAFLAIFVIGGLTGVMVAVVPYDWQVHDTYFVVGHLHFVLLGGLVLPVFAAIYYWAPGLGGRVLPPRWGKTACVLMFAGINITFLPLHVAGLLGMSRRVWTYPADLGLEPWNLAATAGAVVLAAGVAVACLDLILHFRLAGRVDCDPWQAGTLEWLPLDDYGPRSIPLVSDRDPLWSSPGLRREVAAGEHFLPGPVTGTRETLVTSTRTADPQYVLRLPGPGWLPLLAGAGTTIFFFALTFHAWILSIAAAVLTLACLTRWLWDTDPAPGHRLHAVGHGLELPDVPVGGPSHAHFATRLVLIVDGLVFICFAFALCYLAPSGPAWTFPRGELPVVLPLTEALIGWLASAAFVEMAASSRLATPGQQWSLRFRLAAALAIAAMSMLAFWAGLSQTGVEPVMQARAALCHVLMWYQVLHFTLLALLVAFTLARSLAGRLAPDRRFVLDCLRTVWRCSAAQATAAIVLILATA